MKLTGPAHSSQFMERHNSGTPCIMYPKCFFKIVGKPKNYQLYLPNFLKFCDIISHRLLRLTQFLEILEWSTLQK